MNRLARLLAAAPRTMGSFVLVSDLLEPDMDADDIAARKGLLLAAHRAGELTLVRCDMTQCVAPEALAASQIVAGGAEYHMVRVG